MADLPGMLASFSEVLNHPGCVAAGTMPEVSSTPEHIRGAGGVTEGNQEDAEASP